MTMIDNIDISDICMDIDAVGLFRDRRGKHYAAPFVTREEVGDLWESDHDLTDYPAVLAVCRRKFAMMAMMTNDPGRSVPRSWRRPPSIAPNAPDASPGFGKGTRAAGFRRVEPWGNTFRCGVHKCQMAHRLGNTGVIGE